MLKREQWLDLARKLDWTYSYVAEREVFPEQMSGTPWLPQEAWQQWDEPFRTSFVEYAHGQHHKELAVAAVREALGRPEDYAAMDPAWRSALKLHSATLPLAEFAAVIGNLGAARFGRDSAWRNAAAFGALDELRHTQIPLAILHDLVRTDPQFDWTHRFFHSNDWVAIAGRHLVDELLFGADPIELAIGTNFVFETGFTNLQFVGLAALAKRVGDRMFERMVTSIQTDEARHAQIGGPVLEVLASKDPARAQALVDKWFWRSWRFFAVVTGFCMDYLTPVASRTASFKEFCEEWILEHFQASLERYGLKKPWYWDTFLSDLSTYHHMVYASAYSYRATVWFDLALPSPADREWLAEKYPKTWHHFDPLWERMTDRWRSGGPKLEWFVHGATPIGFCNLCQLVLCAGTPEHNTAMTVDRGERRYVFCSEPCRRIFEAEPERYEAHKSVADRILAGEAPANLIELVRIYFGLDPQTWGKDVVAGDYPWLDKNRSPKC